MQRLLRLAIRSKRSNAEAGSGGKTEGGAAMLRLRCYEASLRLSRAKIRSRLGLAVEPCWLAQANELSKEMPVCGWRWAVCGKSQAGGRASSRLVLL